MDEVFVAQLELDGPLTDEATAALREQAATWFGSPRTRHLGTEVSSTGEAPASGPRYLARARFVREPPPPTPEPSLLRAATWLGFVPAAGQQGAPVGSPWIMAAPAPPGARVDVFVGWVEIEGPLTRDVVAALRDQATAWFGSPRPVLLGTEVSPAAGSSTTAARHLVRARFAPSQSASPPGSSRLLRAATWLGFTSHAPGQRPPGLA